MKIAFDLGGVLSSSDILRGWAKYLLSLGHEVYCITVADIKEEEGDRRMKKVIETGILFTGVEIIYDPMDGTMNHGLEKLKVMDRVGCEIMVDDNFQVVDEVTKAGKVGLRYLVDWRAKRPF